MAHSAGRLIHALLLLPAFAAFNVGCAIQDVRPAFRYSSEEACADVIAFALSEDRREQMVVDVDLPRIGRRIGGTYHIPIAESGPASVQVHLFAPNEWLPYCSHGVPDPMPKPTTWVARAGMVKVSLASAPPFPYSQGTYRVEVVLEGLTFVGPKGQIIQAPPGLRFGGFGGWWAGA
jgi:hypothetical protein